MASHHTAAASDGAALAGLAIALLVVLIRVRGRELRPRNLVVLPAVVIGLGLAAAVPQLPAAHPHAVDAAVIATDLPLSAGLGAIRGRTVLVYERDGASWYRYGPVTVALWLVSIVSRAVLGVVGADHGATQLVTGTAVLPMLGLTLLIQNLIVWRRRLSGIHLASRATSIEFDRATHIGRKPPAAGT